MEGALAGYKFEASSKSKLMWSGGSLDSITQIMLSTLLRTENKQILRYFNEDSLRGAICGWKLTD